MALLVSLFSLSCPSQAMRTTFITNVHLSLVTLGPKVADEADSGSNKYIADMTHMSKRVWRMNGCETLTLGPLFITLTMFQNMHVDKCCGETNPGLWPEMDPYDVRIKVKYP